MEKPETKIRWYHRLFFHSCIHFYVTKSWKWHSKYAYVQITWWKTCRKEGLMLTHRTHRHVFQKLTENKPQVFPHFSGMNQQPMLSPLLCDSWLTVLPHSQGKIICVWEKIFFTLNNFTHLTPPHHEPSVWKQVCLSVRPDSRRIRPLCSPETRPQTLLTTELVKEVAEEG